MKPLFGLLLAHPLTPGWREVLLYAGFYLHMTFVLLALGTAFLAVFYSLAVPSAAGSVFEGWDRRILRSFMGFKSLAVVLGVAPLLLIQVGWTLPFFNATGLFAGLWMLVIVLLIASFISFDSMAHAMEGRRRLHPGLGIAALVLLVAVPGIFAAVLAASENPGAWTKILEGGFVLPGSLLAHWGMRFLHVLGAGLVFGALFHLFFTSRDDPGKKSRMKSWLLAGIVVQVVSGPLLILSLPRGMGRRSVIFLGLGLFFLAIFAGLVLSWRRGLKSSGRTPSAVLLLAVLAFMLLVRHDQQVRSYTLLESSAESQRAIRAEALKPYEEQALAKYKEDVSRAYDNGPTIYGRSCAFCHGESGDGRGPDAGRLAIPPEDISQIRASRSYVLEILAGGVRGTAMPYFAVFIRGKLSGLAAYLDEQWGVLGRPPALAGVPEGDLDQAWMIYAERCARCHGPDGVPTPLAAKFEPPPPRFTEYSLLPGRAMEVMTNGYPGTMMAGFASGLPPGVKEALVRVLYELRKFP